MKTKLFLNCTQHTLTKDQIESIKEMDLEILELKDLNPDLFKKLSNSPSDHDELKNLANEFDSFLNEYKEKAEDLYIHLPIGSPAFMFVFARKTNPNNFKILFSHTERECIETRINENEVKREYIFKFKKFIEV